MKLRVTPTALKDWFQYRCERKFIYETMDRDLYNQIPIHEQAVNSSWADEGNIFERAVVQTLEQETPESILKPRTVDEGCLTAATSLRFIARKSPRQRFAHQLLLGSNPTLRQRLRLQEDLEIRNGKVDLVEILDEPDALRFRIIDIKATQAATLFHKIQVAFYALMLEATLAEHGLPGEVDDEGQIWHRTVLGGAQWVTVGFQIRGYMRMVEDFFHQRAPELARYRVVPHGPDETPFHVYFKCEQCKFLAHCMRAVADDVPPDELDLSAVAGVSQQSKRTLKGLGIHSVGGLLQQEGMLRGQDDWALRTRGWTLVKRAQALTTKSVLRLEGQYSLQMPPKLDRPIYLLADRDPVDGRLSTLACLVVEEEGIERHYVRVIARVGEEALALVEILGVILQTLTEVDQWNEAHEATAPIQTHIFTYEPAEAADIRDALGRHLDNPEIQRGLLDLVRIFPPEQVMPEPDYQGFHYLPASALRSVLTDLYAFPVKISHDLARVCRALHSAGVQLDATYEPGPEFARPFSSRLSIELCRNLSSADLHRRVAADVRQRLTAMHALATWVRRENSALPREQEFLRLRKKPFRFRQRFDPLGASDLDVLQAQCLLDSRVATLTALTELARPARQRRDRLNCYADLVLVDQSSDRWGNLLLTFHIPEASRMAELGANEMGLILSDGSPDQILNPENWPGLQAQLLMPEERAVPDQLRVKVWRRVADIGLIPALLRQAPAYWFLDKAVWDLNTGRQMAFLAYLAQGA
jgi:predicted RecB family nuclease